MNPDNTSSTSPGGAGTGTNGGIVLPPTIYKRATMTPEERFRDDCRMEVAKAKEELEREKAERKAETDDLRRQLAEKEKMIEKFEMFIDICNGRVMMQRERLAGEMVDSGGAGDGVRRESGV